MEWHLCRAGPPHARGGAVQANERSGTIQAPLLTGAEALTA